MYYMYKLCMHMLCQHSLLDPVSHVAVLILCFNVTAPASKSSRATIPLDRE